MKKIIAGIFASVLIIASLMSCQDKLDELYLDPEKTSEPSIGKFFTKMLDNDRVRPSYWNVRTFLVMQPGVYTQAVSFTNSAKRYQQQTSYTSDFWRDYYTPTGSGLVAHLREMEKTYAALSDAEKADADVFMFAARIIYYDQTSQLVDMWGDIPFSEAGGINLTEDITSPKFDDAQAVYTALLSGLKDASAYFKAVTLSSSVAAAFSKQDIMLNGNVEKWERYANSIRFRLLMRISFQDESKAQADVTEMLNDPANFPLVDESTYNVLLQPITTYTDNMNSALTEVNSQVAPEFLLDGILKPANDPRIRVLFDKGVDSDGVYNADYFSMPSDATSSEQETNIGKNKYATLDSATFRFNKNFPGIVITSAEVNFLKAEAFERWGGGDAQAAYEKGVTDAVKFLFDLNKSTSANEKLIEDYVTQTEIDDLLASASVNYSGTSDEKLAKIWTQKWLSFGFMQSIQSWAEYRRTKYPVLDFAADNTPGYELPPSRLLYPSNEKTYNAENYAKVAPSDLTTNKIFWDVK
jgi:hypothetical protein